MKLGHIKPSQSPWNTPIFVIKKKSGKWRLLHDLRAINNQMQIMGPIQRGLPLLSSLPKEWPIIIIDIKDCFFSIPLALSDSERFAFTLPSVNNEEPDKRYQWIVLPQGMANSPTMCQLFVGEALQPVRDAFPKLRIVHYIDDVLLASKNKESLDETYIKLVKELEMKQLFIAPDKVQMGNLGEFLGARITPHFITPQKIELRKDHLKTLNDFQKLLGDINWIHPYMRLSNFELIPLFDILKGDPQLSSPRALTPEARVALEKVERCLEKAKLYRWKEGEDILLCVLKTFRQPTGVLWQSGPLLWIYPHVSPNKTLEYYPIAVAQLAILGIKSCIQHFGAPPQKIITPYNANQIQILSSLIDDWALLRCSFDGELDNHYPKDPLLQFFSEHPVIFPKVTASKPISGALDIYTDGSKTGVGAYVVNSQKPVLFQYNPGTPQLTECKIVLEVFKAFKESFNLVSDSAYVVNAVRALEIAGPIRPTSPVCTILLELQKLIWKRTHKFFIQHIRAHSTLPGPMAERNALVDASTRMEFIFHATPLELAKDFHQLYHVPAATLQQKFDISRASARDVVLQCPQCVQFHHPPHVGINPRGLLPLKLWQMDVTHVSAFGRLKYVHVSIDTCSGVIFASPMSGEKSHNMVGHCLEAWAAWGRPDSLKTDNGPAYTSKSFQTFCKIMQVSHSTGLPYNPQGQGIVERAHRTLKELLQKQKGGIANGRPPKEQLSSALFTLNFLILDKHGHSAADRHAMTSPIFKQDVKWKDVLTGKWYGPDPIISRSRGAVCVFPQDQVPERLTQKLLPQTEI